MTDTTKRRNLTPRERQQQRVDDAKKRLDRANGARAKAATKRDAAKKVADAAAEKHHAANRSYLAADAEYGAAKKALEFESGHPDLRQSATAATIAGTVLDNGAQS